jgi:hypothetical protein
MRKTSIIRGHGSATTHVQDPSRPTRLCVEELDLQSNFQRVRLRERIRDVPHPRNARSMGPTCRTRNNVHIPPLFHLVHNEGFAQVQLLPCNNRRLTMATAATIRARCATTSTACNGAASFVADNTTSASGRHISTTPRPRGQCVPARNLFESPDAPGQGLHAGEGLRPRRHRAGPRGTSQTRPAGVSVCPHSTFSSPPTPPGKDSTQEKVCALATTGQVLGEALCERSGFHIPPSSTLNLIPPLSTLNLTPPRKIIIQMHHYQP